MPKPTSFFLICLLLAGSMANARPGGQGPGGDTRLDEITDSASMLSGNQVDEARARQALARAEENSSLIQSKFQLQNSPEAEPILHTLQNQLAQARDAFTAGNYPAVLAICSQTEAQIALLHNIGSRMFTDRSGGLAMDTARLIERQRAQAEWDLQRTLEHYNGFARQLQESKPPNAVVILDKCKSIIDGAKQAIDQGRFAAVRPMLEQVEILMMDANRFKNPVGTENHAVTGTIPESHTDYHALSSPSLTQASETYNRLHAKTMRISDRDKSGETPKSQAIYARLLDMMEKCREALTNGHGDAALALAIKSESLLAEWHQSLNHAKGNAGSSLDRLKVKMDRATEIVAASKNEKASRILEKGLEHFERAQHGQSEGQEARAQVEMDIALKLAAKAVDIARSGQNR